MFADDTSVFLLHSNLDTIFQQGNRDLNHIANWLWTNKLSLNVTKTKYLLFRTPLSISSPSSLSLKFNIIDLARVQTTNFLEVTFQEHLSWKKRMLKILGKIRTGYGAIRKIKLCLSKIHLSKIQWRS